MIGAREPTCMIERELTLPSPRMQKQAASTRESLSGFIADWSCGSAPRIRFQPLIQNGACHLLCGLLDVASQFASTCHGGEISLIQQEKCPCAIARGFLPLKHREVHETHVPGLRPYFRQRVHVQRENHDRIEVRAHAYFAVT